MKFHRTIAALGSAVALTLMAAPAGAQAVQETQHFSVAFTDPAGVNPCVPSIGGVTSVQGDGVMHLTDTGSTFQMTSTLQGLFTFEPNDPNQPSSSGHFVVQNRQDVNFGQLKDLRVTETTLLVAHVEDGTNVPIQIRLTQLVSADGTVEVKVDSVRCGGQLV
jgi:hypothetical protein